MALNLPIFKIVGQRLIKMVKTSDGGADLRMWDWEENDFVQGGAEAFDILMEYESLLGGADVRTVSETEFNAHVEMLKIR